MAKVWTRRNGLFYLRGMKAALDVVWDRLTDLPYANLTVEQKALRDWLLDILRNLLPDEDSLRERPTNAQIARKYAISVRTVSNWRSLGCDFDHQSRVLNWVVERRSLPSGFKLKFARQIQKRKQREEWDELADCSAQLLNQVREAKHTGLL
jgi:hypothetical protein